jgi:hypothetical protein
MGTAAGWMQTTQSSSISLFGANNITLQVHLWPVYFPVFPRALAHIGALATPFPLPLPLPLPFPLSQQGCRRRYELPTDEFLGQGGTSLPIDCCGPLLCKTATIMITDESWQVYEGTSLLHQFRHRAPSSKWPVRFEAAPQWMVLDGDGLVAVSLEG